MTAHPDAEGRAPERPAGAAEPPAEPGPPAGASEPAVPTGAPTTGPVVAFALTTRQGRRTRWGLIGLAVIAWSVGAVRLAIDHRLSEGSGWLDLVVLAVLLVGVVAALSGIRPLVVLAPEGVLIRRGPRESRVAWAEITGIEVRERGTARRAVLRRGEDRTVLPVPLSGGSLMGPGPDPELDAKIEVIRRAWLAR